MTSAGFKRSQLNVRLQSITGEIAPIALLYIVWAHYKIIFLDSVHNTIWSAMIRWVYTLKQKTKKRIKGASFWQSEKVGGIYPSSAVTDMMK